MDWLHALLLGIVQGAGEFLPISSSAHLILLPWFAGWQDHGLAFDVALHMGTLFAVLLYYFKTWINILGSERRLLFYILTGTIPGAVIGLLGKSYAETIFRSPLLIAITLSALGAVLWLCDRRAKENSKDISHMNVRDALLIGISQGFAIVPGFSRSGTTISAALALGYKRDQAAQFSFFLSAPIIAGAVLVSLKDLNSSQALADPSFWLGVGVAFIVGLVAIQFLIKYVSKHSYLPFVLYRFALSAVILSMFLARG